MKQNRNQKRKGSIFMHGAAVLCFLVMFFLTFTISTSFAQQISSDPNYKPQQKVVTVKAVIDKPAVSVTGTSNQVSKKTAVSGLPYYNYNGITDLELAKEAWVKDHPEEYRNMSSSALPQGIDRQKQSGTPIANPQSPGIEQILPKVSDDGSEPKTKLK